MIKEISKKFDRELALKPRLRNQEQRVDQYHSHLRGRDKWLHLQMKKIIQYRRFKNVTLYTHLTRKDFIDLWEKAGGTAGEGIGEKNRFATDQLRLRQYCYGISCATMPNTKVAAGIAGAKLFVNTLLKYFKQTKEAKLQLALPLIGSHRKARRNLDAVAIDVDAIFAAEITKMTTTFMDSHEEGVFVAYK